MTPIQNKVGLYHYPSKEQSVTQKEALLKRRGDRTSEASKPFEHFSNHNMGRNPIQKNQREVKLSPIMMGKKAVGCVTYQRSLYTYK